MTIKTGKGSNMGGRVEGGRKKVKEEGMERGRKELGIRGELKKIL